MKTNRMMFSTTGSQQSEVMKAVPNAEMLSRQIENLRVVVRRMKGYDSSTLNTLINQKLREVQ